MSDATEAQRRAILTRAAAAEAARQTAQTARDWPAVAALELELRDLWREFAATEGRAA